MRTAQRIARRSITPASPSAASTSAASPPAASPSAASPPAASAQLLLESHAADRPSPGAAVPRRAASSRVGYRHRAVRPSFAAEAAADYQAYDVDAGEDVPSSFAAGEPVVEDPALAVLVRALDDLRAVEPSELPEPQLRSEVSVLETVARRVKARQSRLVAALNERERARARERHPNDPRAGEKASRELRRQLGQQLDWSPAEAKQAQQLGEQFEASDEARDAFDTGELPARHATLLADTLRHLVGDERAEAERRLLEAARSQDAVTFGRTCRALLAELDHQAAVDAEARRHRRRRAKTFQSEEGMQVVSAALAGWQGELFATAFHAFRRPDAPDEHRTPEQAGADALAAMAQAALDAGAAGTKHGVRPHVTVVVDWQTVLAGAGMVQTDWSGPLPFGTIRRHLADCGVSRLLTDPRGVPVEAGEAVRTVPAGVRRAIGARDGVCCGDGCDVPAMWCQVMHLDVPYRLDGRLTIDTSAFGCSYHHDRFDRHGWVITWIDGAPVLHHPDRPPDGAPTRGSPRNAGRSPAGTTARGPSERSMRDPSAGSAQEPSGGPSGGSSAGSVPSPSRGSAREPSAGAARDRETTSSAQPDLVPAARSPDRVVGGSEPAPGPHETGEPAELPLPFDDGAGPAPGRVVEPEERGSSP